MYMSKKFKKGDAQIGNKIEIAQSHKLPKI